MIMQNSFVLKAISLQRQLFNVVKKSRADAILKILRCVKIKKLVSKLNNTSGKRVNNALQVSNTKETATKMLSEALEIVGRHTNRDL